MMISQPKAHALLILLLLCSVCAAGRGADQPPSISNVAVLASSTSAVSSQEITQWTALLQREPLHVHVCDPRELSESFRNGDHINALIILDPANFRATLLDGLLTFARHGGSIFLLGDERPSPSALSGATSRPGDGPETSLFAALELACKGEPSQPVRIRRAFSTQLSGLELPPLSADIDEKIIPPFAVPRDGQSSLLTLLDADVAERADPVHAVVVLKHTAGPYSGSNWFLCGFGLDALRRHPELETWIISQARAMLTNELKIDPSVIRPRSDLATALGVTTAYGGYHFTDKDDVAEGADQIAAMRSKSIKLWFTRLAAAYPRTKWPSVSSMTDVAQSLPFRQLFERDFSTYVLEAFPVGMEHTYWRQNPTDSQIQADERQFYELTRYLLTTYRDSRKTFILQNWESDWAARGKFDAKIEVAESTFTAMAQWLNRRQHGVDLARQEIGEHGVHVRCAAEVNLVRSSVLAGRRNVIDAVIPQTNVDLVSYSAYDSQLDPVLFRACLEHIARRLPPKPGIAGCRVMVGEYGIPENPDGTARVKAHLPDIVDIALAFGCPYVMYWQLYCNEPVRQPVVHNVDTRGLWLIRPDGTKAWAWDYLHGRILGQAVQ